MSRWQASRNYQLTFAIYLEKMLLRLLSGENMPSPERLLTPHEQQIPHGHREIGEHPGIAIVRQTNLLFTLFYQGALRDPRPARNYLRGETIDYLETAEKGSMSLFKWQGVLFKDVDPTIGDAAHHAMLAFAHMPEYQTSLQDRAVAVAPPRTIGEFKERLDELKTGVSHVVEGRLNPDICLAEHPPLFRTFEFFRVASELPLAQ